MSKRLSTPREIWIILTYRCNAKCNMCNVWHHPTKSEEEIQLKDIDKLPSGLKFIDITGGEPFIRPDISEIIEIISHKAKRIVINTNGFFTDRIVALYKKYPDLGIRISIDGLQETNDTIRGIPHGFSKGLNTLLTLRRIGIKDIGIGMTVQDMNCKDLIPLYEMSNTFNFEFATSILHNSHYFHKLDNCINNREIVCNEVSKLILELLHSMSIKNWFRAYFNYGLMNYIYGGKRFLKCEMGTEACFLDPSGDVLACNGMDVKISMGNLKKKSFEDIWNSEQADNVRNIVKTCDKQCWMICNVARSMKKHIYIPAAWVIKKKIRAILNRKINLHFPIKECQKLL